MAQTGGPVAGPQLVCVDAIWCGPALSLGGQDCNEGCFCGDSGAYLIKTNVPNAFEPHCEWLCSSLAVRTSVPQISFNVVKHTDGNLWFGSQWKNSKVVDWWNLALAGKIKFADLADDVSRIYALDLFVHNEDRHMNNYFVAAEGNSHKIYSYDFGRAWLYHGFPPPAVMKDPAVTTVQNKNWLKANFGNYFNKSAAEAVLDQLEKLTERDIENVIKAHPAAWLPAATATQIIDWWKAEAPARLKAIRDGFNDGTLL